MLSESEFPLGVTPVGIPRCKSPVCRLTGNFAYLIDIRLFVFNHNHLACAFSNCQDRHLAEPDILTSGPENKVAIIDSPLGELT